MDDRPVDRERVWLSVQDVAHRLAIDPNTVKRIPPGDLPYWKFGLRGDRKYDPKDVRDYVRSRRVVR